MTTQIANISIKNMSNISKNYIPYSLLEKYTLCCHNLAKWLSHYLFLFLFLFSFYLGLTTQKGVQESVTSQVSHSHSHMMSHNRHGKVVHRSCSSCISSVENLMGTLSSSLCQMLNKEQLA